MKEIVLVSVLLIFRFWDGGVPRTASCGVCFSRLVFFSGVCGGVGCFSGRGLCMTERLLRQGY